MRKWKKRKNSKIRKKRKMAQSTKKRRWRKGRCKKSR